ncbi:flippase-like domain-containing protein [Thermobifida halotolerans]|uniref:Flippase-like domain-containing protein n=1 Tax=Thermobifida halotolerans TaxID=483545 RepID=A0AA97LZA9_9ACTN|nr:lysylphosphatidylglycerol synthase transmembrane domain-containing protein [Thermobifida halotolerans]UOE21052.1 flippase-like domain-containing protein [Thermobifida halotolerans]
MRTGQSTPKAAAGPAGGIARRPFDLLFTFAGAVLLALALLVVAASAEPSPVTELPGGADPPELRSLLPPPLLGLAAGLANLTVLLLGGVTVAERLASRDLRHVVRSLAAAGLGYGATVALNTALVALTGPAMPDILSVSTTGGVASNPLHAYLAAVVAYLHASRSVHLPRVMGAMAVGVAVTATSVLLSGYTTALSLVLTLLVGAVCASLVSYVVGMSTPPPAAGRLVRELTRLGLEPLCLDPVGEDSDGNQRFVAETVSRRLDVTVVNSDPVGGVWKRLLSKIVLRNAAAPPLLLGLRDRIEHTALLEYAAAAAGTATPRLLAVGDLEAAAAVLVREHVSLRPLTDLADTELTDAFLDEVWAQLRLLHRHRIAHRAISPDVVTRRADGRAAFVGLSTGSIAAGTWAVSLDNAALLVTLALRVGPRRAVASAVRNTDTDTVAAILPFLQSAGLPPALRRAVRAHRGLLGQVREEISRIAPHAPAQPVQLERMPPRTVVTVAVVTVVGLALAYQLAGVDWTTISDPDPAWTGTAVALSLLCVLAPAIALLGFSPVRLRLWRTVLVQYASSFVRIATPAGVGSLAINTRYLVREGATTAQAVSAVGVSQLAGVVTLVPLLVLSAYLSNTDYPGDFSPSFTLLVVVGVLSVLVAAVLAIPRLRRAAVGRLRPHLHGVLPQLLDLIQQPRRLLLGLGGTLLLTVCLVLCLYASLRAFGVAPSLAAVGVVYLAGNAIGSAAPSPGGLGAVEAALIGGLTAVAGVPAAGALSGVLLFRLLTFWLPVLPGWLAFTRLQHRRAI